MMRSSTPLVGATAAVLAFFLVGSASTDSYIMVHPGTDCTVSPHIAWGMYGSTHPDHPHGGYWNEQDQGGVRTVFCPIGMLTRLHLAAYDWDETIRVALSPVESMATNYSSSRVILDVYLTRNNPHVQRFYCWVSFTYTRLSGQNHFDWDTTPVIHPHLGYNHLEFDLSDLYSPWGYATLVCKIGGVDDATGLPSQVAGYILEVGE